MNSTAYSSVADELYPHIEERLVDRLLKYYLTMKTSQLKGDWEMTALNAGKFAEKMMEISFACVGVKPRKGLKFEKAYQELMNHPKKTDTDVVFTHLIPTVARSIYTLRNKRGVAHSSEIDPNFMDASCTTASCDWMLSELLRVHHKSSDAEIERLIANLIKRRIPAIQEIDGETIVLKTGLSARNEILAILSHHYPDRIAESKLHNDIISHSRQNINTSLRTLEKSRLVHRRDGEVILTDSGLRFVDSEGFRKILMMEDG